MLARRAPTKQKRLIAIFVIILFIAGAVTVIFSQKDNPVAIETVTYINKGVGMSPTYESNEKLVFEKVTPLSVKRGEVIAFERQSITDQNGQSGVIQIKRVIGLPGDRVIVQDGRLRVTLPDGSEYKVYDTNTPPSLDIHVEADHFFVLGDNLENSLDSRFYGSIPFSEFRGRLKY